MVTLLHNYLPVQKENKSETEIMIIKEEQAIYQNQDRGQESACHVVLYPV